jgi:hypothetical protein
MTDSTTDLPKPRRSFIPFLLGLPIAFGFIILILLSLQYRQIRALVSKTKGEIQVLPFSEQSQKAVLERVLQFVSQQRDGDSVGRDTLVLSENEVNHLIRVSPVIAPNWDTYQLKIQDTLIHMINVMPAYKLTGPVAWMVKILEKDGWLNSEMVGELRFEKGRLLIHLTKAIMNGIDAPVSNFNRDNRLNPHLMASDSLALNRTLQKLAQIKTEAGAIKLIR